MSVDVSLSIASGCTRISIRRKPRTFCHHFLVETTTCPAVWPSRTWGEKNAKERPRLCTGAVVREDHHRQLLFASGSMSCNTTVSCNAMTGMRARACGRSEVVEELETMKKGQTRYHRYQSKKPNVSEYVRSTVQVLQ